MAKAVRVSTVGHNGIDLRFNTTPPLKKVKTMTTVIKILLVLLFLTVVVNLFRAMFSMLKQNPECPPMSHFIGKRLVFSVAIVVILFICLLFGWIEPNSRPY
jgi:magnesium-transporting ATPase (P-type)